MLAKHVLTQALGASFSFFFVCFVDFDIISGSTVLYGVCGATVLTWVVEGIIKVRVFAKLGCGGPRLRRSHMLTKPEVPYTMELLSKEFLLNLIDGQTRRKVQDKHLKTTQLINNTVFLYFQIITCQRQHNIHY